MSNKSPLVPHLRGFLKSEEKKHGELGLLPALSMAAPYISRSPLAVRWVRILEPYCAIQGVSCNASRKIDEIPGRERAEDPGIISANKLPPYPTLLRKEQARDW